MSGRHQERLADSKLVYRRLWNTDYREELIDNSRYRMQSQCASLVINLRNVGNRDVGWA